MSAGAEVEMRSLGGDRKAAAAGGIGTDFFGRKPDAGSKRSLRELLSPRSAASRSRASGTKPHSTHGPFRLNNALPGRAIALRTALQVRQERRATCSRAAGLRRVPPTWRANASGSYARCPCFGGAACAGQAVPLRLGATRCSGAQSIHELACLHCRARAARRPSTRVAGTGQ